MSASTFLSATKLIILLILFSSFYSKGISCEFSCFHIPSTSANVCSSRGICVETNNCTCSIGIYGSNCQWSEDPVLVEPNLEVFGLSGGIVRRNVSNPTYEVFVTATKLTYLDYKLRELLGCDLESYNCQTLIEFKWSIEMNSIILDSSNGFVKGNLSQVDVMTFTPTISFQSKKVLSSGTQLKANIELKTKYSNINFTFTSPISNPPLPPSEKTPIISNGQVIDTLGTISSFVGVALSTRFTFELRSWVAAERMGPLMYAIGFYDYANKKDMQLSEFSSSRTYSTFIPYIESNNGKIRALVFVSDRYGNIETRDFNIELTLSPYNGTQSDLLNFMNSTLAKPLDFTVYSYDQSFSISGSNTSGEILLQVAKNTVIDTLAPSVGLSTIEKITEQTNLLSQELISILNVKINNFLKNLLDLYKQNKESYGSVLSTILDSDVRKVVTIASNIFISGYSNETKLIADNLVDLLIFGKNPTLILSNIQSLDVVSYYSTSINVTIASFLLDSGLNSTQSISSNCETNVNLNLTSIMEQYNGFSKESGASLVTYTRNFYNNNEYSNRNRISSNLNEFKFYQNQQVLILQDLKNPLELTFKLLNMSNITLGESSFTTIDSSDNQVSNNISNTLTCVYFDTIDNNWNSKGCTLKPRTITQEIATSVTCLCSHTTMFSTFIEQNSTFTVKGKQQLSTLYYAQISLGIFYMISSCVLLVLLFIFRKEQPISSRLATPFMGMIALLVESCLIYVTQRGILVNQLKNGNTQMWESGDGDSNIIANIVTIFVNSLNLTAIFCYVIQVVRFELMKFMYKLIHKTKGNESKSDLVLKTIRFSTSSSLFLLLTTIFMTVNLVYWTIWVVLRRINVIDPSTYTYIVSISYTVIIFFLSVIICTVLVFDFIATIYEKKQEKKNTVNISNSSSDSSLKEDSIKKSFKMNPFSRIYDFFISLDEPLYFRVEMIIYLTCFVFLIVNQVIGLLGLPYRFVDEETYKIALKYDVISFIFEVLYVLTYILVFGGYALIVLLVYKFKIWKRKSGKNGKSKENDGMLKNKELLLVLNNEESYESFEKFCDKEFSLENLYLHTLLEKNSEIVDGERMEGLSTFLNQIYEGFIQSGAPNEVNIPNNCRTKIVNLYNKYGFEKKDSELKNIDYEEVKQAFFSLVQQVLVNLGDTFSRYSLTTEWKVYKKAIELKEHISEKTNLQ